MHMIKAALNKILEHITDIILLILLVTVFNIFFPYAISSLPDLKKGDIAPKDVVAPFSFQILKHETVLEKERQSAYNSISPVLKFDDAKTSRMDNDFKGFMLRIDSLAKSMMSVEQKRTYLAENYPEFSAEMHNLLISDKRRYLLDNSYKIMTALLKKGIIADKSAIPYGKDNTITIISEGEEKQITSNDILDNNEVISKTKENIIKSFSSNSFLLKYGIELIQHFVKPNITIDIEETNMRREKARNEISQAAGMVLKGEIIVRAHDIVSQPAADKMRSLRHHRSQNNSPLSDFTRFLVKNLIMIIILILYFVFINTQFIKLRIKLKDKILIVFLFAVNLIVYGLFYQFAYIEYLIPIIITSAVLSLLYSRTFALISIVFLISIIVIYSGLRIQGLLALFVSAIYCIYLVKRIEKRTHFVGIILKVSAIAVLVAFCVEIFKESAFTDILLSMLSGFVNILISILLVILLLPFIERLLSRITNITLLDLSDLNNKLLRMEAEEATGTFHHSLTVSNLAEKAAKRIGANELLTRVGAYYHDIGKLLKPEYFIENQTTGFNPHESLPPELSAEIIKDHVSNGAELARENKLPNEIISFIISHHGTSGIDYFINKARERKDDIDIEKFKYTGPLPVSKENAIVMLADSVEAAVRSLKTREEKDIRKMIEFIFSKKLNEGQMDQAELSVNEINAIKDEFTSILISIYHMRVEYKYHEK